jgi:pyruvate,orthophosphate dikinase
MLASNNPIREGDIVTLNGNTGEVILGEVARIGPELPKSFHLVMEWADAIRKLRIRANAETVLDAKTAIKFGAEGIGLCRTEHMFFSNDRINNVREMIVADNVASRNSALAKLLPMQRADFEQLFELMGGMPVTIRLLDPPLHEFLPHKKEDIDMLAKTLKVSPSNLHRRIASLEETNPMLGHRGCRLAITYPEIYEMQVRAIFQAAIVVATRSGKDVIPEIMIPLVMKPKELGLLKERIDDIARELMDLHDKKIDYMVGTMIELPCSALNAGLLALHASFFSFGTNDLTQTTLGISRDDVANFMSSYKEQGIFVHDPFEQIDDNVQELIDIAVTRGREINQKLKIGICGEHGGDPKSVTFFHEAGLDYVSCSPYRLPIARLAAAQAAIKKDAP